MGKKPEWDFDATTPVSSNRRVLPLEGECRCCGHAHRNKGASIVRCSAQIELANFKRRPCRCSVYGGLRRGSKKKVVGPFWGTMSGASPYHHLWHYEEGGYAAWSACGRERPRDKVYSGESFWKKCRTCEKSPLAAKAPRPTVEFDKLLEWPRNVEELVKLHRRCQQEGAKLKRRIARGTLNGEDLEVAVRAHLELLRSLPPAFERLAWKAGEEAGRWHKWIPRKKQ